MKNMREIEGKMYTEIGIKEQENKINEEKEVVRLFKSKWQIMTTS